MFCKNCGADLPEGSIFCGSCGSKQDEPAQTPVAPAETQNNPQPQQQQGYSVQTSLQSLNNLAIGSVKGMRLIGFIAMALVALFTITTYMYCKVSIMGQSQSEGFNFLFGADVLSGDTSFVYTVIMCLIFISNIAAIAGCAGYIVFTFMGGAAANSVVALKRCVLCATVTFVALVAGLVLCFICPSPIPSEGAQFLGNSMDIDFGYYFHGWLSIVIAAAVRFYVLPICLKEAQN